MIIKLGDRMRQVFLSLFCFFIIFAYYLAKTMRPLQTQTEALNIQVHIDEKQRLITMPAYSQVKDLMEKLEIDETRYESKHLNLNDYLEESVVYSFRKKEAICISINEADKEKLEMLPGIGPKTAEAILDYRQEHGPFMRLEDLLEVKGIGEKKLEKMSDQICL